MSIIISGLGGHIPKEVCERVNGERDFAFCTEDLHSSFLRWERNQIAAPQNQRTARGGDQSLMQTPTKAILPSGCYGDGMVIPTSRPLLSADIETHSLDTEDKDW